MRMVIYQGKELNMHRRPWRVMFKALLAVALLVADTMGAAHAAGFDNSLWIGNDTGSSLGVLNTDTTGAVLRTLPNVSAIGFAVDVANGKLYIAEGPNVIRGC